MSTERSASASLHLPLYRQVVTLAGGRRLVTRLLNPQDREALTLMLREAPEEELRFLKAEITEPRRVEGWLERLNYRRLLPLAAVDLDAHRMMGLAILARGRQATEAVGDIEIFVSPACRNQGLGSLLIKELQTLAAQEGLHWLKAEVAADQRQAVQAYKDMGFAVKALFEDYFCDPNGSTRDAVLLMCSLSSPRPRRRGPVAAAENAAF